jgi:hypothetical protein
MRSMRARALAGRGRVALATVAILCAFGQAAEARVVGLRWSHPDAADVDGFRVHYGTSPGSYTVTRDVGRPAPSGGVFSYGLTVADDATVYVAITAYGSGFTTSHPSNEKRFAATTTPPPPPPPTEPSPFPVPSGSTTSWSQDFQSSAIGSYVPGWRDTGDDNSLGERDSLFGVIDLNGTRVFATSSELVNIHSHLASSGADLWSSYGFQGRMRISDPSGGIGVTVYSQYPRADVYYRLRRYDSRPFEVSPHGTSASCSPADTGVVPAAGAWYRFRFEVVSSSSSNTIRAKVWREGTAEPGSWQTSCTDSSSGRPTRGTVGVWSMRDGQKLWDDLTVYRLGGSSPPAAPPQPPILIPD